MNRQVSSTVPRGESRSEAAYRAILGLITDRGLADGDRLPAEAELAKSFGVSRPVVRQALTRLQEAGVVQIRWGAGTYVRSLAQMNVKSLFGGELSLPEVRYTFELRVAIEGEAARLAAERATDADRAAIAEALERVNRVMLANVVGEDADMQFHLAIARASQNPYFEKMMVTVREPIQFCARLARMLAQPRAGERARQIVVEHEAVVAAILARQPDQAAIAMRRHVALACDRIFNGVAKT